MLQFKCSTIWNTTEDAENEKKTSTAAEKEVAFAAKKKGSQIARLVQGGRMGKMNETAYLLIMSAVILIAGVVVKAIEKKGGRR